MTNAMNKNTKIAIEECPLEERIDGEICINELKMVMSRLGIASDYDDDVENDHKIGVNEFSAILLDEEPSLLEIEQVFQVFDENKDGCIDATEVERVLLGLCLIKEGSDL
ncbi:hypothetical protein ACH5RR_030513 [Cinchona calisaya]|uniref:EF-hand domain-containing protein n=1 Tax=Cinchona calisaya TaxID=153742 RepID=A0ABD2YZ38_9GENT